MELVTGSVTSAASPCNCSMTNAVETSDTKGRRGRVGVMVFAACRSSDVCRCGGCAASDEIIGYVWFGI